MNQTKHQNQTEMPWATAEKLARQIIIGALAIELRNSARSYKRAIALRKEFKGHGIKGMDYYDGKTYDDLGRCPVCYKSGEQVGSWAVCREHNVRWPLNIVQLERHQPQPLDPDQKEFLDSLREVLPLNEPPQWFGHDLLDRLRPTGHDLFDRLRPAIEVGFIDAVMDHEWADHIMSKAEIKKFYAIRKQEGRKINPETAEVMRFGIGETDPYGLFPARPYDIVNREPFYRNPGSDIWVFEDDVPVATRKAIRKEWDSRRCSRKP